MKAARIATVIGGAGSVGAMLAVGFRNEATIPLLLLVLFTGWVVSPFVALLVADRISDRRTTRPRRALRRMMLIIPVASLAIYGYVLLSPPRPKPASTFLLVPLGSWLLLVIALIFSRYVARNSD